MWFVVVVIIGPLIYQVLHLVDTFKYTGIQHPSSQTLVKSFYKGILSGFSRLYLMKVMMGFTPLLSQLCYKFRAIVYTDDPEFFSSFDKVI